MGSKLKNEHKKNPVTIEITGFSSGGDTQI